MDTDKRHHLQDIYQTDQKFSDDFTPQVSKEIFEERQRDIMRHRFTGFLLGSLVLLMSVAVVYVVFREYRNVRRLTPSPTPITQEYIPRYTLPSGSQWVMDFGHDYADPKWNGKGTRPFNATWVKKAAFNLILAEQAANIGDNERAVKYYTNAQKIFPDLEGIDFRLGLAYFKLDDFENALKVLETVPEDELSHDMLNNLGAACIRAKAFDKAERYFKQAIEMKPTYADAIKNLAGLYQEMERENDAISAYEKYLDLRPGDVDTQHNFALYLTKLGRWEQAALLLESLTEEVTDVSVLYFLLAQVQTHNGNPDKAMTAMKRGIQLLDPNSALAWMNKQEFETLRKSDEFQQMIEMLEKSKR
ncbi:MAG: tetratricopeptide repeat protein [Kiritimatiellales bacterium]|nr:tetratricopeptide repeat protein [Kiritimatiellales bacterium]